MSIESMLERLVDEGDLIECAPQLPSDAWARDLYITKVIADELDSNGWEDAELGYRFGQLRSDFDRFVVGDLIEVALDPYDKPKSAFMARLGPTSRGLWSIRSTEPRPAIRVLGAFICQDTFIALCTCLRRELDGPNGPLWQQAINNADARWASLFPGIKPLVEEEVSRYVSANAEPV
ncbi:hypothetical protein GCM10010991_07790 [Gemmobacter aquaticus]|uniref:Uncharacterized protein n=2 Tax=Gemmobacter aquaticus TaxID=490185 RepID=A0A918DBK0_9RHOB|nr:hypothetical protein GCM10010991_07790 [Gemmobacter aquaticus]